MEEYDRCIECGAGYAEQHHVIFRSQAKFLEHSNINKIRLCPEHHRGNSSPHRNKKIDLKYKKMLQVKLQNLFSKNYYTLEEIKNKLQITDSAAQKLVKVLPIHKEGYDRIDVVKRCLGGRLYE